MAQATSEFECSGITYQARKFPARDGFHCARRLAPMLAGFGNMASLKPEDGFLKTLKTVEPMLQALAAMPDADCNYIIDLAFEYTQRQDAAGVWAGLCQKGRGFAGSMFHDIGMKEMLFVTGHSMVLNLSDFLPENLSPSLQTLVGGMMTNPAFGGSISPTAKDGSGGQ